MFAPVKILVNSKLFSVVIGTNPYMSVLGGLKCLAGLVCLVVGDVFVAEVGVEDSWVAGVVNVTAAVYFSAM